MASEDTLVVYIGGLSLKPEAWVTLTIAMSGFLLVVAFLWISSIGDYSDYRNHLLRVFTTIGSVMVFSAMFIPDDQWLFFGIFAAFSLVPIGLSGNVLYNSYLPILVENHWLIRRVQVTYLNIRIMRRDLTNYLISVLLREISTNTKLDLIQNLKSLKKATLRNVNI